MKKTILAAVLFFTVFLSNSCTGSGDEITNNNKIILVVDGLSKIFNVVSVNTTNPETITLFGQINGSLLETVEIIVYKNATGNSAIPNIIFTQNDIIFYSDIGSNVSTNVSTNGTDRKLKGSFQGTFRSLSNGSKIVSNGSFNVSY
jgi:hypothetical protein